MALQHSDKRLGPFDYVHKKLLRKMFPLMNQKTVKTHNGTRDLVFMHVPYNFGHTIEKVAMFPDSVGLTENNKYLTSLGLTGEGRKASWPEVKLLAKDEAD